MKSFREYRDDLSGLVETLSTEQLTAFFNVKVNELLADNSPLTAGIRSAFARLFEENKISFPDLEENISQAQKSWNPAISDFVQIKGTCNIRSGDIILLNLRGGTRGFFRVRSTLNGVEGQLYNPNFFGLHINKLVNLEEFCDLYPFNGTKIVGKSKQEFDLVFGTSLPSHHR